MYILIRNCYVESCYYIVLVVVAAIINDTFQLRSFAAAVKISVDERLTSRESF